MTSLKSYTSFTTKHGRDIELNPLGYNGKVLLVVRSRHIDKEIRAALDVNDATRLRDALDRFLHQEQPGQPIKKGQFLGHVGSTGESTGPHLRSSSERAFSWAGRSERAYPRVAKLFEDLAEASRDNDVMISFSIVPYGEDDDS